MSDVRCGSAAHDLSARPALPNPPQSPARATHRQVCVRGGKLAFAALVFAILAFDD